MPGIRTLCQRLCESFKLPAGDSISGIAGRPWVSCDNCSNNKIDFSLPTQPFIQCLINNVEVHALIDTGSMRTFISNKIHSVIDFDNSLINTTVAERCVSITGGSLSILGHLTANVKFPKSKVTYKGRFLVSNNISYDCVLGWDFLIENRLSLKGNFDKGCSSYFLTGLHGRTNVSFYSLPKGGTVSGVTEASSVPFQTTEIPETCEGDSTVLIQSRMKADIAVVLDHNVVVPARTEMIVEGRLMKSAEAGVGMIAPLGDHDLGNGIHVAHAVVCANGRNVFLRVMNALSEPAELKFGTKVAAFSPLVESHSKVVNDSCGVKIDNTEGNTTIFEEVINRKLDRSEKDSVLAVLSEFEDVFEATVGHTNVVTHTINTGNSAPIKHRPRRLPYAYRDEADRQIKEMLAQGIIRPSTSPWSSPIVLVKKRSGELRFCVDYRKLNQVTLNDSHPIPNIADILDSLGEATYFSTLDLRSGYWQISVDPRDQSKTAFVTSSGLFEFNRMSFGLKTAPATFQRAMEIVLAGLTFEICLCYLDDVICFGRTLREHNDRLRTILNRFREHNLRVKLEKCQFAQTKVAFLGHVVSKEGIRPDPIKVEAVKEIAAPTCLKELRSFLGLASYYRRFILNFATIAAPLTKLTTKAESKAPFHWSEECDNSFTELKRQLCSTPLLAYPKFDREFTLYTDASDVGLGVVLSQRDDNGVDRVIAYGSRSLTPRERNYATTEKEALAIHYGTQHFRLYLLGRKFKIVTDHSALRWLNSMEPKGRVARWLMDLQEFEFSVQHRAGKSHGNADALSRLVNKNSDRVTECSTTRVVTPVREWTTKAQRLFNIPLHYGFMLLLLFRNIVNWFGNPVSAPQNPSTDSILNPETPSFQPSTPKNMPVSKNNINSVTVNRTINLHEAQRQDECISKIIELKLQKKQRPDFKDWKDNPALRNFWHNYERLFMHNDLLVRSRHKYSAHPVHAIVIPQSIVPVILKGMHDNPSCGHLGSARTEERIRERFYWPNLRASVKFHIQHCLSCQRRKSPPNPDKAPMKTIDVGEPFTFWALDYMGPVSETARGNKYILVVMDHFTKWCEAFPTKDQKASTVANILISKVFSRFGPPVVLHSDQGSNFESTLMHEICNIMGITKTRTTAYHPSGDGQVERQNRTLQDMLANYVSTRGDDWDVWLDPVVYAYNTSKHESTGFSPYEIVFGKLPRMPLELEFGVTIGNPSTQTDYAQTVRTVLQNVRQIAKERLEKVRSITRRRHHNQKWKPYVVGQTIWVKRPKKWKFGRKWIGPYKVVSRLGVTYRVRSNEGKEMVVHHDNLKLCYIPLDNGRIVSPGHESGDFTVVHSLPQHPIVRPPPHRLRGEAPIRPRYQLRQNIRPPVRYSYDTP